MQHTPQFFCRAFSAYWGCQVKQIITSSGKPLFGTMINVNEIHCQISFGKGRQSNWDIKKCQLALKPLSAITEEDALEVYKMVFTPVGGTSDFTVRAIGGVSDAVIHIVSKYAPDGNASNGWMGIYCEGLEIIYRDDNKLENPDTYRALLVWDFLRGEGYDCGYGNIPSLISAGIAVIAK